MNIGTDGVWIKAVFNSRYRLRKSKTDLPISHIENNSFLLGLLHKWFYFFCVYVHDRFSIAELYKAMGENISGPKMLHEQFFNRQWWIAAAKIDHHRNVCH